MLMMIFDLPNSTRRLHSFISTPPSPLSYLFEEVCSNPRIVSFISYKRPFLIVLFFLMVFSSTLKKEKTKPKNSIHNRKQELARRGP